MTDPVEFDSKNIFCNIAVLIKTQFSPVQLLKILKKLNVKWEEKKILLQKADMKTG